MTLPTLEEWRCPDCLTFFDQQPDPYEVENTPWCPDSALCEGCGHCRCTGDC